MKKSRFTETQIVKILKEAEAGVAVEDLSRQYGFSKSAFYKWKAKYGGLDASDLRRLKELEEENRKLKEMYANLSLKHQALKDIVEKSYHGSRASRNEPVCDYEPQPKRTASLRPVTNEPDRLSLPSQNAR